MVSLPIVFAWLAHRLRSPGLAVLALPLPVAGQDTQESDPQCAFVLTAPGEHLDTGNDSPVRSWSTPFRRVVEIQKYLPLHSIYDKQ